MAKSPFDTTTPKAAFPPGTTSIDSRSAQTGYGEILQKVVAEAGASDEPPGRELLRLAARCRGPHGPSRSDAPAFKAELRLITGAKGYH